MEQEYIQVGIAATRNADGSFNEPFPLFMRATDSAKAAEQKMFDDIGPVFAEMMRQYVTGCRAAGLQA